MGRVLRYTVYIMNLKSLRYPFLCIAWNLKRKQDYGSKQSDLAVAVNSLGTLSLKSDGFLEPHSMAEGKAKELANSSLRSTLEHTLQWRETTQALAFLCPFHHN